MEYLKNYFTWERVIGVMKNDRRAKDDRRQRDSRKISVFSHVDERRSIPEKRRNWHRVSKWGSALGVDK